VLAMCKRGCGRHVQPGLTRGLKHYDTCCKKCGIRKGPDSPHDEHDANCGGTAKMGARRSTAGSSGRPLTDADRVKKVMDAWKDSQSPSLKTHITKLVGGDGLGKDGVKPFITDRLFSRFDEKLSGKDEQLWRATSLADASNVVSTDELEKICREAIEFYYQQLFPEVLAVSTESFVAKNERPLDEVYALGEKLGEGSFGVVYKVEHKISNEHRVCKRISKTDADAMPLEDILAEIQNMAMLDHPNVIKVYEYFDDAQYVSQIMEPCMGGELQDRIDAVFRQGEPKYDEGFMRDVIKQTLRALAFMHSKNFLHKDLKPQNIMMTQKGGTSIKVIDFGLAEMFKPKQEIASCFGGTLLYMSPQAFEGRMSLKCDIWATGVILYNMITGTQPFMATWPPPRGRDEAWWQEETMKVITSGPMADNPELPKASSQCRGLMDKMLTRDPNKRLTAAEALEEPWFTGGDEDVPTLSVGVAQCLDAYSCMPELKKAIFLLMAHQSAEPSLEELRAIFTHFDGKNQGTLSSEDLQGILEDCGMKPVGVDRIIHALDRDNDNQLGWTEFIAAAFCVSVARKTELVDAAFAHFDRDGDDTINTEDLARVIAGNPVARERWDRRLPELMAELCAVTKTAFSPDIVITKQQFREYVGQQLNIQAGDRFYAVQ